MPSADKPWCIAARSSEIRPREAFKRLVNLNDADLLAETPRHWKGAAPVRSREVRSGALADFVESHRAGTLMIDSVKDMTVGLSDDVQRCQFNMAIEEGHRPRHRVLSNHHQRKAQAEKKRPDTLDDVYGPRGLPQATEACCLLWGKPNDPIVTLHHVKSPRMRSDRSNSRSTSSKEADSPRRRNRAGTAGCRRHDGLEAADAARQVYETDKPSAARREKIRRQLEELVKGGVATSQKGIKKTDPARYFPLHRECRVKPREAKREAFTDPSRTFTNPRKHGSRTLHGASQANPDSSAPRLKGP